MKTFRIVLLVLATLALLFYMLFVFDLFGHWIENEESFRQIIAKTELYLALYFAIGYYFLWKNALASGILWISWHIFQWGLVLWVWEDGAMTLIFGFPIAILGILSLVYHFRMKMLTS